MDGECGRDVLSERIGAVEKLMLELRKDDQEAVRVALKVVNDRMEGFPSEYAKKLELEQIRETALLLDKTALRIKDYEVAHNALKEEIRKMMSREGFDAYVKEMTEWRRNQDAITNERLGVGSTWKQMLAIAAVAVAFLGFAMTVVIFIATHYTR